MKQRRRRLRIWGTSIGIAAFAAVAGLHVSRNVAATSIERIASALPGAMALKSNEMAEFAYQTGCLEAYVRACQRIDNDELRSGCQREGLKSCGGNARSFRSWIEQGRTPR